MLRFVSLSSQFSLSHALRKLLRKTGNVHRQISKHILVPNWKVLFIYSQEILSKIAWYACGMQRINLSVIFMGQQNIPSIEDAKPPSASLESLELKLSHYRLKLWSAFSWPDLLQRVWWAKFYFSFLFFFQIFASTKELRKISTMAPFQENNIYLLWLSFSGLFCQWIFVIEGSPSPFGVGSQLNF